RQTAPPATARLRQPRRLHYRPHRPRERRHARRRLRTLLTMLLVDTGVFLAAADDNDPDHQACVDLLTSTSDELLTTALVVAEAAYLIDRQLGAVAEAGFFRSLGNGDARVEQLTPADFARAAELIERYADFPLGGT